MGQEMCDQMNGAFIERVESLKQSSKPKGSSRSKDKVPLEQSDAKETSDQAGSSPCPKKRGKLLIDASVAHQDITFPADLDLLNSCRAVSEGIIDELYMSESDLRLYCERVAPRCASDCPRQIRQRR